MIQNGSGTAVVVRELAAHPDFSGANSPDIGLIRFDPASLADDIATWDLASPETIKTLSIGTQVGTTGFPGELQSRYLSLVDREDRRFTGVIATFKTGWIGRLTTFAGEWIGQSKAVMIQHSASFRAVRQAHQCFGRRYRVGVTNASLQSATKSDESDQVLSAAEIGFAIRSDVIQAFIDDNPFERYEVIPSAVARLDWTGLDWTGRASGSPLHPPSSAAKRAAKSPTTGATKILVPIHSAGSLALMYGGHRLTFTGLPELA